MGDVVPMTRETLTQRSFKTFQSAKDRLNECLAELRPFYEGENGQFDELEWAQRLEEARQGQVGITAILNQLSWAKKELDIFHEMQEEDD